MKASQLHTASDRRDRFAGLDPKVWLDKSLLRTWVIAEPGLIIKLLRDPRAVILSIDDMLDALESAYGVEFPNVRFAARHLPLFLEGDRHAERRRSFSRYLAGRLAELDQRLPDLVQRHCRPLRDKRPVELVSEVTGPLVRDINAVFVGRPLPDAIDRLDLLDLFALNKSLTRFKDLDRRVREAKDFLGADDDDEISLGNRFTALAMGFETLMTMLTEGLHAAFRESASTGQPAVLPAHPIETGVPISYRRAATNLEVGNCEFKAGDLLRLQLQALGYISNEADRTWIFGAGAHSCIGKQASLKIWAELKQAFDGLQARGRVRSYDPVSSHYLLRYNVIHVEVE